MSNVNDVRVAAQSLYFNTRTVNTRSMDVARSHSINFISEDFLAGYMQDGRMSVVRRFFCLFVTFDLFFVSLLWLICIMITGDNIYNALKTQVLHFTIYTSLFDIVMAAVVRFTVLLLFYALLQINHWIIIALSTSGSCAFLICKVFVYDWLATPQPVLQVVLIVTSFVLAWGEAWFLDCRVIPQERHARSCFSEIFNQPTDRSPLIAPFLSSVPMPGESIANFYSPYESIHNSDEEDEQDEEYRKMGVECVRKAYDLLQASDWKIEKVTSKNDTIKSIHREKLGKIYRLTARVKYPAKQLLEELFYKIEEIPKWNPTLLESKIVRKIDSHTDITYQVSTGGPGNVVKSRDFVNLRCWHMCRDGKVIVDSDDDEDDELSSQHPYYGATGEGSISTVSEDDLLHDEELPRKSLSAAGFDDTTGTPKNNDFKPKISYETLSKSLGAKGFSNETVDLNTQDPPPLGDEDEFSDANDGSVDSITKERKPEKVYISAAISVDYPAVPLNSKYARGQNLVSCWATREVLGNPNVCIFEWLMCLDLKVYIPKFVLDAAYLSLMQDYMTHLRKHCSELRKRRKVPDRISC